MQLHSRSVQPISRPIPHGVPLVFVAAVACGGSDSTAISNLELRFAAEVAGEPAECGTHYPALGQMDTEAEILDLRFYVSNLRLTRSNGDSVPFELTQSLWQGSGVALLDFEDASAGCDTATDSTTYTTLTGSAAGDDFTGLSFDVGVPFESNHSDLAAAPAPLNVPGMFWSWGVGHKFVRVDVGTADMRWNFHLGSTMCESGGMTEPPVAECARPNRVHIELSDFDPATSQVVLDVASLLEQSDLTRNTPDTATGCQSFPNDAADCAGPFQQLALSFEQGTCIDGCAAQSVFQVR